MSTTPDRSSRATAFGLVKESEREQSGAYPIGDGVGLDALESDAVIAELAPELVSLIPEPPPQSMRPRLATPSERAELVIEDLSLSLDNPYLASSLVPPPKRPFPLRRAVAIASGMLAAAAVGAAVQFASLRSPHEPSQAAGGVSAPAPVAAAARVAAPAPVARIEAVAAEPAVIAVPAALAAPTLAKTVEPKAPAEDLLATPVAAEVAAPVIRASRAAVAAPAPPEPAVAAPSETVDPVAGPLLPTNLPEYPTREQVTAGFESVRAALSQCAAGKSGTAMIKASIASSGRVSHALVSGPFDGPEGSCMARAVRDAQFPAFSQSRLKVSYPIAL